MVTWLLLIYFTDQFWSLFLLFSFLINSSLEIRKERSGGEGRRRRKGRRRMEKIKEEEKGVMEKENCLFKIVILPVSLKAPLHLVA